MKKNKIYIFALIVFVLCACGKIETVEQHRQRASEAAAHTTEAGADTINVSIYVSYATIYDNPGSLSKSVLSSGLLKEDGVLIVKHTIGVEKGTTVYGLLKNECLKADIPIDYNGTYIKAIGYLYEFDCGPLSGWMYKVGEHFPKLASDDYVLEDGDSVEWLYSCDLGKDVGDDYYWNEKR